MTVEKYGKESGSILKIKKDFFDENRKNLDAALNINGHYSKQPKRQSCMNCATEMIGNGDFSQFGIEYSICNNCSHLNGIYEDSDDFTQKLYSADAGENYSKNYLQAYDSRVENIYVPKVQFLKDVLLEEGLEDFSILDIGCGGGHFVRSCELLDVNAIGIDPNAQLIELGSSKIEKNTIEHCGINSWLSFIQNTDKQVLSMIGVLEHLQKPRDVINAFLKSNATYLYISVPLFSFSVFIQQAFQNVFPRQLSGGHTHLYTKESLEYLADEFDLEAVGEWWFGTDMVDLYRSMMVESEYSESSKAATAYETFFGKYLDEMQLVLDQHKRSSEVHIVYKKKS